MLLILKHFCTFSFVKAILNFTSKIAQLQACSKNRSRIHPSTLLFWKQGWSPCYQLAGFKKLFQYFEVTWHILDKYYTKITKISDLIVSITAMVRKFLPMVRNSIILHRVKNVIDIIFSTHCFLNYSWGYNWRYRCW